MLYTKRTHQSYCLHNELTGHSGVTNTKIHLIIIICKDGKYRRSSREDWIQLDICMGNSTVLCITLHVGITKAIFEFLKFLMQFKCLRNGGWWWCVYPIEKCKVVYCTHLHSPFLRYAVGPVIVGAVWGVLESFVLQDTRQYCIKMFGCQ